MPAPVTITKPAPVKGGAKPPAKAPANPAPSLTPKTVISGVPVWSLYDELRPISDLKGRIHPRNDNKHDDTQTLMLAHIIRKQGVRRSIIVSRLTGRIIVGHGALKAAISIGMDAFPVTLQDFNSEDEELAHLMADNEIARLSIRDDFQTAENLDLLRSNGVDLSLTGILDTDQSIFFDMLSGDTPAVDAPAKKGKGKSSYNDIEEVSDALPGAHALKPDMLFTPEFGYKMDKYDMPLLDINKCMAVPEPFDSWAGPDGSPPQEGMHYLYNITSVMRELPINRSLFGFYADDHRFEVVWNRPDSYAAKLINAGFMGAVTPNFSLYAGAPYANKIYNVYRSRWVGKFFQEAGINVIPDVQTAGLDSLDYCLAGIPKGLPAICIQFQTAKKTDEEIRLSRAILAEVEKRLGFQQIIVYGGDHAEKYLEGVFKHAQPFHILNRMQKRRAVIRKNASAAAKMK